VPNSDISGQLAANIGPLLLHWCGISGIVLDIGLTRLDTYILIRQCYPEHNFRRSSVTERSFLGIAISPFETERVTHVSNTNRSPMSQAGHRILIPTSRWYCFPKSKLGIACEATAACVQWTISSSRSLESARPQEFGAGHLTCPFCGVTRS
jgi:hypothetical protein